MSCDGVVVYDIDVEYYSGQVYIQRLLIEVDRLRNFSVKFGLSFGSTRDK